MLNLDNKYTQGQIHEHLGGSLQSYLPTARKRVVYACRTKTFGSYPKVVGSGWGRFPQA